MTWPLSMATGGEDLRGRLRRLLPQGMCLWAPESILWTSESKKPGEQTWEDRNLCSFPSSGHGLMQSHQAPTPQTVLLRIDSSSDSNMCHNYAGRGQPLSSHGLCSALHSNIIACFANEEPENKGCWRSPRLKLLCHSLHIPLSRISLTTGFAMWPTGWTVWPGAAPSKALGTTY